MKTINVIKSYLVKGVIKKNEFKMKTIGDLNVLFNNALQDAEFYARLRKGKITHTRETTSLYINYTDVPNSDLIDTQYLLT